MTYRPKPKYASRDAHQGAWVTCDDCSFIWNMKDMAFQYDYVGGPTPINLGYLRCPRCITPFTEQRRLLIIPPDPPPLFNTRPEPYTVDETNWLTDQDGSILDTVGGVDYITSMPNPANNPNTTVIILSANLTTSLTELTAAYLDLFNGNPAAGGTSILGTITGSATRSNVVDDLEVNGQFVALNPDYIIITSGAEAQTNVSHVGIYDAASGGTLLASGQVGATFPTIVADAVVRFDQLGLRIQLSE